MLRKVLIGALVLTMLGGFAIGAVLIAREAILGPQTAQAHEGQGRGAGGVEANEEGRQGRGRGEEASATTQGRGAGEDCSENTLPSDAGQGRGRGEEVTAKAQGRGTGAGRSENTLPSDAGQGRGQESGGSGGGRSESESRDGQGAGNSPIERNPAWEELRGTVVEYDHEMTVATADGEVLVGMGQSSYVETQGFQASKGDVVIVYGFHEDGEFKAGQVENLTQGKTLVLRDQDGRPMWAGNGNGKNRS